MDQANADGGRARASAEGRGLQLSCEHPGQYGTRPSPPSAQALVHAIAAQQGGRLSAIALGDLAAVMEEQGARLQPEGALRRLASTVAAQYGRLDALSRTALGTAAEPADQGGHRPAAR